MVKKTVILPAVCRLDDLPEESREGGYLTVSARREHWTFVYEDYHLSETPRRGDDLGFSYPLMHSIPVARVRWKPENDGVEVWLEKQHFSQKEFELVQAELTADLWKRLPEGELEQVIQPVVPPNHITLGCVVVNPDLAEGVAVVKGAKGDPPVVITTEEREMSAQDMASEALKTVQEAQWGHSVPDVLMDLTRLIKALSTRYVIPRPGEDQPRPRDFPGWEEMTESWPALWTFAAQLRKKYSLGV
jgi:hypothetical protein